MGVPIWYSVGLLITLSPEIAKAHNIDGLKLSTCFILFQVGICTGGLAITGCIVWGLAILSVIVLPDTFGKSLAFTES